MAKTSPAKQLADNLVRVLEAQRQLGGEAYPPSLQRLAELTDPQTPFAEVEKVASGKLFTDRALVLQKKNRDSPVFLRDDLDRLVDDPRILEFALESVCTPANPAQPLTKLKMALDTKFRKPFEEAVSRRIRDSTLPPAVGCRLVKNKPQLYLQRMPPIDPEVALAGKLLRVLESQKQRGGDAYPVSLPQLLQMTDPQAAPKLILTALATEPFRSGAIPGIAVKSAKSLGIDVPVALSADRATLAGSRQLLEFALRIVRTKDHCAAPLDGLMKKVSADLAPLFADAVKQQMEAGSLPPTVGWMRITKKQQLFLMEDVHGTGRRTAAVAAPVASAAPTAPAAPATPPTDFAAAFEEAFHHLDREAGAYNFVSLLPLRRAVPVPREVFDQGLRQLRLAGRYTLSAAEGRHGITPEEQQAAIQEDGGLLLYVSRKSP